MTRVHRLESHYMAPPVDELGYNRVGGLDVLPDFLDVDDCCAVEVAVARSSATR